MLWIVPAQLPPYLYTMKATNKQYDKVQPSINLQSFYDFAKLNKEQQVTLLTKEGTLLDLDKGANCTTRLYLLKGFFVEETTCSQHNVITDIVPFKSGYRVITYLEVKEKPAADNSGITSYSIGLVKKIAAAICIIFLSITGTFAQNTAIGAGADYYSSGSGHGTFYSPQLMVSKGNGIFSAGPVIQKRSGIMNGFKMAYTRNLTGDKNAQRFDRPDVLQINAFGSFQYNNKLPLCYSVVKQEGMIHRENTIDLSKVQFSTVEATIGFGAQVNITRCISWKTYVGVSVYYHPDYVKGLDHQRTGNSVTFGTGITFLMF